MNYNDILRPLIARHRWLVAMDVLVPAARYAHRLQELGSPDVFALGGSHGTGTVPDDMRTLLLGTSGTNMMDSIRTAERAIDALSEEHQAALDAWDPDRTARVLRTIFSEGHPVGGRPVWGARRPEWVALEDKTVIDELWDATGVQRAPYEVVPMAREALAAAGARLDQGLGVVWAGDNTSGWHGGASFTRWVTDKESADRAWEILSPACERARVMPFLEGIPCSIHGMVFDDTVLAFRPCEMIVLRRTRPPGLQYAAASTYWDPTDADREDMRAIAKRVGAALRERVNYRGVFTIDGVMSAEGFRPTELNPRFGAAIGVMTRDIPNLDLYLLHCAVIAGEDLDYQPQRLEKLILEAADANRDGRAGMVLEGVEMNTVRAELIWDRDGFRVAREGEPVDASFVAGPNPSGTYAHINFIRDRTPVGPPLAHRACAAFEWMAKTYDVDLAGLQAARSVR